MTGTFNVPLGDREVSFALPEGMRGISVAARPVTPLADLDGAVREALVRPVAGPRLRELAAGARTACLVVTDTTRASPDDRLVPPLLAELEAGGIAADAVTILVATGLHRATTAAEKADKLGAAVTARYRVLDHDAFDPAGLVDLGTVTGGVPAIVARIAVEADLLVATGIVEPHQFAGFSGGRKTVAIGVAGEATIGATHGVEMLDRPGTRLANLEGNAFHEAATEIAERAGLRFIVNVVADEEGRPVAVAAGAPGETFASLVEIARELYTVAVPRRHDIAVAGVGHRKDANLYQASRAPTYLHFAPVPIVRRGGVYLLLATIPEGAGEGTGERRFFETLSRAASMPALVAELRRTGYRPGEQRAFIVARMLAEASLVVVGAERPDVVRACHMAPAATMEEGLREAERLARASLPAAERDRPLDVLVVPHATRTLPVVATG